MDDHKTFHNKFGEQKTDEISIQNTNLLVNVLNDQFEKEKMQMFEERKGGLNFLEKGVFVNIITADVWEMQ